MVCCVHWTARLLGARNRVRNAVCSSWRISRKESFGKLAESYNLEPCLESCGRKQSEMGAQEKQFIHKGLRWEGTANNIALSALETEVAKSFPISWVFVCHGLVRIWWSIASALLTFKTRMQCKKLVDQKSQVLLEQNNTVTISVLSIVFLFLLNNSDTESAVVSFVNWSMTIQCVCLEMSSLHVGSKGRVYEWLTVPRAVWGWRGLGILYMQCCY